MKRLQNIPPLETYFKSIVMIGVIVPDSVLRQSRKQLTFQHDNVYNILFSLRIWLYNNFSPTVLLSKTWDKATNIAV